MEEIEYLEEYEDLVLPAINSTAPVPNTSKSTAVHLDDGGSSSSLDQDIFNCLFDDNSDDENDEQRPKNDEVHLDSKQVRSSLDSLDLLNDLDEQITKELELKKPVATQPSNKIFDLNKNNPKANLKALLTSRPKVVAEKKSGKSESSTKKELPKQTKPSQQATTSHPLASSSKESGKIRKPLPSATSTSSLLTTKKSNFSAFKPATTRQRTATVIKPEKNITKDPVEDPLNLDDFSSGSINNSVSDISGATYHSLSDFDDDDDYDFTGHTENLDDDDDEESSSSQVIDISNDSSESRSQLDDFRHSTPSPTVSPLPSVHGSLKSPPKLLANHEIIKCLLNKGEKPKLLQLITKFENVANVDSKKDSELVDKSKTLAEAAATEKVSVAPKAIQDPLECDSKSIVEVIASKTIDPETPKSLATTSMEYARGTQSPENTSNDSYLSVVNEMLEESYEQAMKTKKHTLLNQEVGAEMEISVENIAESILCQEHEISKELQKLKEKDVQKQNALVAKTKSAEFVTSSKDLDTKNSCETNKEVVKIFEDSVCDVKSDDTSVAVQSVRPRKKRFRNLITPENKDFNEEIDGEDGFQGFQEIAENDSQNLDNQNLIEKNDESKQDPKKKVETIENKKKDAPTNIEKTEITIAATNTTKADKQHTSTSKMESKNTSLESMKESPQSADKSKERDSKKERSREASLDQKKESLSKHGSDRSRGIIRNPFVQRNVSKECKDKDLKPSSKDSSREKSKDLPKDTTARSKDIDHKPTQKPKEDNKGSEKVNKSSKSFVGEENKHKMIEKTSKDQSSPISSSTKIRDNSKELESKNRPTKNTTDKSINSNKTDYKNESIKTNFREAKPSPNLECKDKTKLKNNTESSSAFVKSSDDKRNDTKKSSKHESNKNSVSLSKEQHSKNKEVKKIDKKDESNKTLKHSTKTCSSLSTSTKECSEVQSVKKAQSKSLDSISNSKPAGSKEGQTAPVSSESKKTEPSSSVKKDSRESKSNISNANEVIVCKTNTSTSLLCSNKPLKIGSIYSPKKVDGTTTIKKTPVKEVISNPISASVVKSSNKKTLDSAKCDDKEATTGSPKTITKKCDDRKAETIGKKLIDLSISNDSKKETSDKSLVPKTNEVVLSTNKSTDIPTTPKKSTKVKAETTKIITHIKPKGEHTNKTSDSTDSKLVKAKLSKITHDVKNLPEVKVSLCRLENISSLKGTKSPQTVPTKKMNIAKELKEDEEKRKTLQGMHPIEKIVETKTQSNCDKSSNENRDTREHANSTKNDSSDTRVSKTETEPILENFTGQVDTRVENSSEQINDATSSNRNETVLKIPQTDEMKSGLESRKECQETTIKETNIGSSSNTKGTILKTPQKGKSKHRIENQKEKTEHKMENLKDSSPCNTQDIILKTPQRGKTKYGIENQKEKPEHTTEDLKDESPSITQDVILKTPQKGKIKETVENPEESKDIKTSDVEKIDSITNRVQSEAELKPLPVNDRKTRSCKMEFLESTPSEDKVETPDSTPKKIKSNMDAPNVDDQPTKEALPETIGSNECRNDVEKVQKTDIDERINTTITPSCIGLTKDDYTTKIKNSEKDTQLSKLIITEKPDSHLKTSPRITRNTNNASTSESMKKDLKQEQIQEKPLSSSKNKEENSVTPQKNVTETIVSADSNKDENTEKLLEPREDNFENRKTEIILNESVSSIGLPDETVISDVSFKNDSQLSSTVKTPTSQSIKSKELPISEIQTSEIKASTLEKHSSQTEGKSKELKGTTEICIEDKKNVDCSADISKSQDLAKEKTFVEKDTQFKESKLQDESVEKRQSLDSTVIEGDLCYVTTPTDVEISNKPTTTEEFSVSKETSSPVMAESSLMFNIDVQHQSSTSEESKIIDRSRTLRKRGGTESPLTTTGIKKDTFKYPPKSVGNKLTTPTLECAMKRKLRSPATEIQGPLGKRLKFDAQSSDVSKDLPQVSEETPTDTALVDQLPRDSPKQKAIPSPRRHLHRQELGAETVTSASAQKELRSLRTGIAEDGLETAFIKNVNEQGPTTNEEVTQKSLTSTKAAITSVECSEKNDTLNKPMPNFSNEEHGNKESKVVLSNKKSTRNKSVPVKPKSNTSAGSTVLSFAEWLKCKTENKPEKPLQQEQAQVSSCDTLKSDIEVPVSIVPKDDVTQKTHTLQTRKNRRRTKAALTTPKDETKNCEDSIGTEKDVTHNVEKTKKILDKVKDLALSTDHASSFEDVSYVAEGDSMHAESLSKTVEEDLSESSCLPAKKSRSRTKLKKQRVVLDKDAGKTPPSAVQKSVANRPQSLSPTKRDRTKNKRSEIEQLIESMSKEMKDGGIEDLLNSSHVKRQRISKRMAHDEETSQYINVGQLSSITSTEKIENNADKSVELPQMSLTKQSIGEIPQKPTIRRAQAKLKVKKPVVAKETAKIVLPAEPLSIEMEKALIDDIEIRNMNTSLLEPLNSAFSKESNLSPNVKASTFKEPKLQEKTVSSLAALNRIQSAKDVSQLYTDTSNVPVPKQLLLPSICRELKVRLNRSFVKNYWKRLQQDKNNTKKILVKASRSPMAPSINSSNLLAAHKKPTGLRKRAVVSNAKLRARSKNNVEAGAMPIDTDNRHNQLSTNNIGFTAQAPVNLSTAVPISIAVGESTINAHLGEPYDNVRQTQSFAEFVTDAIVPVELKHEFLDEQPPNNIDDTVLPDTPTLMARAQSITQAAADALSNAVIPTDIRLLRNDSMSSETCVPSFGVTPTLIDAKGTRMYTFLHPAKYSRNHGNVLLDYCCPNLNGPMPAIDPTRIHAQIQTPVIELPSFIVLTTKVVTRSELESNSTTIPAIIRKKAEKLRGSLAIHKNLAVSGALTNSIQSMPQVNSPHLQSQALVPAIRPPQLSPAPHLSPAVNALAKYLPSTTTITAKVRPPYPQTSIAMPISLPHPNTNQPSSVVSVVANESAMLNEMQVNLLRSNLRRFDVILKKLVQPYDKLNFAERHQLIEDLAMSGKFLPNDIERSTVLMEEYLRNATSLIRNQITNANSSYAVPATATTSSLSNVSPLQMPPLQPAPNLTPTTYKNTTCQQMEQSHNSSLRKAQSTVKQPNTTMNNSNTSTTVKQRQVPIYDTERNIIGYQLQVITPSTSMPAYTKSTMSSNAGGIMSASLDVTNGSNQRRATKRPAQGSPRVFYTSQPLHTSTPKANLNSTEYSNIPLPARSTKATAKSQQGPIVTTTVRSAGHPTSAGTETITTTTMATVKRVTRSRAAGSKIIIVSKTNSNEETILPDVSHQTEIKDEKDMEDFVG